MGFRNFDFVMGGFPVLFSIFFGLIVLAFVLMMIRVFTKWRKNKAAPVLTVAAKVVAKRIDTRRGQTQNAVGFGSYVTYCYATFEVESGDRMELEVASDEYGYLVEGDAGKLTFQGTWFKEFSRDRA